MLRSSIVLSNFKPSLENSSPVFVIKQEFAKNASPASPASQFEVDNCKEIFSEFLAINIFNPFRFVHPFDSMSADRTRRVTITRKVTNPHAHTGRSPS